MRTLNFWKTLFCAALLTTVFTACSDDEKEGGYSGIPEITVNGTDKAVVAAGLEGGTTEAIEVVTKGNWKLSFKNSNDATWCTPSKMSGSSGTSSLTFQLAATTAAREAIVLLNVSGEVAGFPITKEATITVKQNASGSFKVIFKETFGTAAVDKTAISAYTGWVTTGSGAAGVTFEGTEKTDLRLPAKTSEGAYEGATGSNALFFGTAPTSFMVKNIELTAEETNLQLTFGGNSYVYDTKDNTFNISKFKVSLSDDGETFVPLTYTINDGDTKAPYWVLATADFTLTKPATKLYIKFEAETSSIYRLDDIMLQTGDGGQSIDLEAGVTPPEPTTVTISQIIEPGTYEVKGATVITRSEAAYMIADATGAMLVYDGTNERAVGDKIDISGEVTIYQAPSNTPQFGKEAAVTVVSTGNAWTYTYVNYTATEIQAYLSNVQCVAVQIKGTIVKDGSFYNLVLNPEVADLQGSIQYYTPTADQLDKPVIVKGYALGKSASGGVNRIKIFPHEIVADASTPFVNITAPAQFSADGATANVAFSSGNLGTNKLFAKIEGADAAQFSVPAGEITGTSVAVTAIANESELPKNAKLVIYAAATEGATTVVASDEVALSQAGVPTGDDTKGTYTSMAQFISDGGSTANPAGLGDSKANGADVSGFKVGTSSKVGTFTSTALNVTGDKKLGFYAEGWKGVSGTALKITVNNGGSANTESVILIGNDGAAGNIPFADLTPSDVDNYYIVHLTGLTSASTITFETTIASKGRAVVFGVQLF